MGGFYHPSMTTDTLRKIADIVKGYSDVPLEEINSDGKLNQDFYIENNHCIEALADMETEFGMSLDDIEESFYSGAVTPQQISRYIDDRKKAA